MREDAEELIIYTEYDRIVGEKGLSAHNKEEHTDRSRGLCTTQTRPESRRLRDP